MKADRPRALNHRTNDRLTAYKRRRGGLTHKPWTRFAAATGAAVAGASTAEAAIVHVIPPNPIRAVLGNASYVYTSVDLDADGQFDFALSIATSTTSSFSNSGGIAFSTYSRSVQIEALGFAGAEVPIDSRGEAINLASGQTISSGLVFDDDALLQGGFSYQSYLATAGGANSLVSSSGDFGNFPAGGTGLVGVRFNAPTGTHLGWVRVGFEDVDGLPGVAEILEWAYEDAPNTPILAGATSVIPEPAGLALLATGAAGVACLRRR
ncbi:MAG: PEP-CTERM sorting domain-containing protein [Planctomycetota bacterium]